MLDSNGKTNGVRLNALIGKFIFAELAMRGGRRMNDKALGIGNIRKQRKNFKVVNKFCRFFSKTFSKRIARRCILWYNFNRWIIVKF